MGHMDPHDLNGPCGLLQSSPLPGPPPAMSSNCARNFWKKQCSFILLCFVQSHPPALDSTPGLLFCKDSSAVRRGEGCLSSPSRVSHLGVHSIRSASLPAHPSVTKPRSGCSPLKSQFSRGKCWWERKSCFISEAGNRWGGGWTPVQRPTAPP